MMLNTISKFCFAIALLILWFPGFTQTDQDREEYIYKELIAKSEGKSITWSEKSRVTGYKNINTVKIGEWLYYDEFGNLIKKENYRKVGKHQSVKDGIWEYFSPNGDRIKVEVYQQGVSAEVQYYQACIIRDGSYKYDIAFRDTVFVETVYHGSIKMSETVYNGNIRLLTRYFSALNQKLVADNQETESKFGNPALLVDSMPNTHKQADNLVANPSFENHPNIKFSITSIDKQIENVYRVSGSPDFYYQNTTANKDGEAALGFRVYTQLGNDIEYFALSLKDTMHMGQTYCFKFYLKLGAESNYAAKRIGVIFTNQVLRFDKLSEKIVPHIRLENDWLIYKSGWMRMECTYTAKGGEKFINIGTFYPDKELELIKSNGLLKESYYYVEDVSVRAIASPQECNCNAKIPEPILSLKPRWGIYELEKDKSFILDDIYFENDKFNLLPKSFEILDNMYDLLSKNPTVCFEIQGHTSSVASREYNLELSAKRANTVRTYFIEKGIAPERLTSVGLGPDFPITNNDNEVNQAKNRRVVFRVTKL